MSHRLTTWVWDRSKADKGALLVALALADATNTHREEEGCWPRQDKLAEMVRLTVSQVSRCVQELAALGEIEVRRTRQGNHYYFRHVLAETANAETALAETAHGETAPMLNADSASVRNGKREPEVEPERTTSGEQQSLVPEPADELFVRWQRVFEKWDQKFTPARRRAASKALKEEPSLDVLEEAMRGFKVHRERKSGGVELGDIFGTYAGTGDLRSRIEWARALAAPRSPNASTTVQAILATFPSDAQTMVRDFMQTVEQWAQNPQSKSLTYSKDQALRMLANAGVEPTMEGDKLTGWKRAS